MRITKPGRTCRECALERYCHSKVKDAAHCEVYQGVEKKTEPEPEQLELTPDYHE